MRSFGQRMLGAAMLHADTFEEVEADSSSIRQAIVVVLGATAAVAGSRWIQASIQGVASDQLGLQMILTVLVPLVLWVGGSAFSFMVGATS